MGTDIDDINRGYEMAAVWPFVTAKDDDRDRLAFATSFSELRLESSRYHRACQSVIGVDDGDTD